MRKEEKAQESEEAEKNQEVTTSDGVVTKEILYHWAQDLKREHLRPILSLEELAEIEDAWRTDPSGKMNLSFKYFPEANPRFYRVYHSKS